jgi:hypothetical protein
MNMEEGFAWDIRNGYIKRDEKSGEGVIAQRQGITKLNTTTFTNACKCVAEIKWKSGSLDTIIREGTRWAKYNSSTRTFDNLDTSRGSGNRGMVVMFNNELIMVDGGIPRKSTSAYVVSNLSTDAAMPQDSTAVHVHDYRVWLNSPAEPMKAYGSKYASANAADSWSAVDDAIVLDHSQILPSGDRLLGYKTFAEKFLLCIFTRYVVVWTTGPDTDTDFVVQQVIPLNCASIHGVAQVGNDLAIPSLEGLNSFKSSLANQDLDIDDLSKYISPLYRDTIGQLSDVTEIVGAYSHALNHYYLCVPTTTHQIFVYSLDIKNFVGVWEGYKVNSICEKIDGTMLVGGDGYVYAMNNGYTDDGTAIDFSYSFPFIYFGSADVNKIVRQIEGLAFCSGSLTMTLNYSWGTTNAQNATWEGITLSVTQSLYRTALYRSSYYRASGNVAYNTSNILGRGKQFGLTLSVSTSGVNIEIPYLIIRYAREGRKLLS